MLLAITGWLTSVSSVAAEPQLSQDVAYKVTGLSQPAHIIVDRWGVPHIYAQDHYDVFFAQGFNAARDRLWQIDLWRKRGLGRLAETFGPDYVQQDRATRLFLYRKDMYSEWLAYGNDAKKITQAFVAGINAYIQLTKTNPDLLPPEFDLLGYQPEPWRAEDVVRIRSNGLWRNVNTEVWRARLACAGKLATAARWKQLEPPWQTQVPDGLDPCVIPDDVLRVYHLAKAPVSFSPSTPNGGAMALQDHPALGPALGSNNWAVSGRRTNTGRPILADDPHRSHAVPSLRYIAHLVAPGINVIGAGEPALPGISIGHNKRIAFGLTIFPIDQEDLYVYRKSAQGYRYQDRDEPFTVIRESIPVAGHKPHPVTLKFTRHGPVVAETGNHAFVVRAAWLEPGMAPYFGSIEYMRAQNFRTFSGALNRWGAPSENQVYADVEGNIGYKPAGRFPVRKTWDGLLPVPGDGRHEWQGYFDMDTLPEEYNPRRGFTGTANSMNLPPDYPIDKYRIGFEWSSPWRYQKLWQVLTAQPKHSIQDALDLQHNYHSLLAQRVISKLPDLSTHPGGKLFQGWDYVLAPDSAAAALWSVWYTRHLVPAMEKYLLGSSAEPVPGPSLDALTVLDILDTQAGQDIAYTSLAPALAETEKLLGSNPAQWQWGALHQTNFAHPLLARAAAHKPSLAKMMRLKTYPRGGARETTNSTGYSREDFSVQSGASFRMVVDVGQWDEAYANNAPGQSGDPRSYFYDNLLENWAADDAFSLVYSAEAVEKNKAFTVRLVPET